MSIKRAAIIAGGASAAFLAASVILHAGVSFYYGHPYATADMLTPICAQGRDYKGQQFSKPAQQLACANGYLARSVGWVLDKTVLPAITCLPLSQPPKV